MSSCPFVHGSLSATCRRLPSLRKVFMCSTRLTEASHCQTEMMPCQLCQVWHSVIICATAEQRDRPDAFYIIFTCCCCRAATITAVPGTAAQQAVHLDQTTAHLVADVHQGGCGLSEFFSNFLITQDNLRTTFFSIDDHVCAAMVTALPLSLIPGPKQLLPVALYT